MFKMTIHVTQSFDTEAEAKGMYNEVRGDVKKHKGLHLNCQITKKFSGYNPTFPNGHEVES